MPHAFTPSTTVKTYVFSFDRPRRDDYRRIKRELERRGLSVERMRQKTHYKIARKVTLMSWGDFRQLLTELVDPHIGVFTLMSLHSGRVWEMSNRGNRRGKLVKVVPEEA